MRRGLVTGVLGRILLGAGALILLFVAYQLWGTGIAESHSQSQLRREFAALEHRDHAPIPSTTTTTAPSSTSTTATVVPTSTTAPGDQPTVGPTVAAPGNGMPVGLIEIPKIGVNKVIIEGTDTDDLRQGPGHYTGTPIPGEQGNAAIAGHRTTYGAPFYNLDELKDGDPIYVTTVQGHFTYRVTGSQVVSPSDSSVVANTADPELTLTTCNPRFSASTRLVVHAALSGNTPPAPTLAAPATPKHVSAQAKSQDLAGSQGDWTPTLWLGIAAAAVITLMFVVARRRRGRLWRWTVYVLGGAASLVVLFFFFGAVSPLLPASF